MCFIDYNFFPILFFLGWNILTAKQFTPNVSQTERKLPISFFSSSFSGKEDKTLPSYPFFSGLVKKGSLTESFSPSIFTPLSPLNTIPLQQEGKLIQRMNDRVHSYYNPFGTVSKSFYSLSSRMCLPLQQKKNTVFSEVHTSVSSSLLPARTFAQSEHEKANHSFWPIQLNDWAIMHLLKKNTRRKEGIRWCREEPHILSRATGYDSGSSQQKNSFHFTYPIKNSYDRADLNPEIMSTLPYFIRKNQLLPFFVRVGK